MLHGPSKMLLLKALEAYKESINKEISQATEAHPPGSLYWELNRIEEAKKQLERGSIHFMELMQKGGRWLGVARDWMKCTFRNGETVTWGSQEYLEGRPLTVSDVEYLAAKIAAAAMNDYRGV